MLNKEYLLIIIRERGELLLDYSDARDIFGFRRVDGLDLSLRKIGSPSLTEEHASYPASHKEVEESLRQWCRENNLLFTDRAVTREYYIGTIANRN